MVGFAFSAIDQHATGALHQLIQMHLGGPELAMRTLQVLLNANRSAIPVLA